MCRCSELAFSLHRAFLQCRCSLCWIFQIVAHILPKPFLKRTTSQHALNVAASDMTGAVTVMAFGDRSMGFAVFIQLSCVYVRSKTWCVHKLNTCIHAWSKRSCRHLISWIELPAAHFQEFSLGSFSLHSRLLRLALESDSRATPQRETCSLSSASPFIFVFFDHAFRKKHKWC